MLLPELGCHFIVLEVLSARMLDVLYCTLLWQKGEAVLEEVENRGNEEGFQGHYVRK